MRSLILGAALLMAAAMPTWGQRIYRCTQPGGAVTYQEQPCPTLGSQKNFGTARGTADEVQARRALEAQERRGEPLAGGFVDELRERDRIEALEREERRRQERESARAKPAEAADWNPPWGWAGPPGLARPKPAPVK